MKKEVVYYCIIALSVLTVSTACYFYFFTTPDPAANIQVNGVAFSDVQQAHQALKSNDKQERAQAAIFLATKASDESMIPLMDAAETETDPYVRGRLGAAMRRVIGANYFYRAKDPPEKRAEALKNMRVDWDNYLKYKNSK